jgi:hypothetical protein
MECFVCLNQDLFTRQQRVPPPGVLRSLLISALIRNTVRGHKRSKTRTKPVTNYVHSIYVTFQVHFPTKKATIAKNKCLPSPGAERKQKREATNASTHSTAIHHNI